LKNNQFSPNAISHKELNNLLQKAKKEILLIEASDNHEYNQDEEFNALITEWKNISKKILIILNKRDILLTKDRSSKSLIAFGAMGAHISMALQALKSI
tara:strand:- start:20 stop:316 length:297 start_codon:yes stop_codon:yes gene_type:complete